MMNNSVNELTSEQADAILVAAVEKSIELSVSMNIAVVDSGANLKAFKRMDGAWLGSIDIASEKLERLECSICRLGKLASYLNLAARSSTSNNRMVD